MSGAVEQPLHVCLIGPSLDILGGQAVQLQRLSQALAAVPDLDVGFVAVNPRLPGPLAGVQRVRFVRTLATTMAYVLNLVRDLRRFDVAHCYSASYWSFLLAPVPAMLVGRLFGLRVLLNYHSGEAADHLRRSPHVAPALMRLAHTIVVPSHYLARIFAGAGLETTVIANSIDLHSTRWRARDALRPRLLSNRNLEPMYGVHHILTAFREIQRHHVDASLMVAGDGRERARLENHAAALALRHVSFIGRIEPDRMSALYDDADVFVNASTVDNMPLSLIEASLAGLPIVTSDAGGIPEMFEHGRSALLVPVGDASAMANAVLRLLAEPGLGAALAGRARADAFTHYDSEAIASQWAACYRRQRSPTEDRS